MACQGVEVCCWDKGTFALVQSTACRRYIFLYTFCSCATCPLNLPTGLYHLHLRVHFFHRFYQGVFLLSPFEGICFPNWFRLSCIGDTFSSYILILPKGSPLLVQTVDDWSYISSRITLLSKDLSPLVQTVSCLRYISSYISLPSGAGCAPLNLHLPHIWYVLHLRVQLIPPTSARHKSHPTLPYSFPCVWLCFGQNGYLKTHRTFYRNFLQTRHSMFDVVRCLNLVLHNYLVLSPSHGGL